MKKFLTALLAFLLWAAFALLFHQYVSKSICQSCNTSHEESATPKSGIDDETVKSNVTKQKITNAAFVITATDSSAIFNFPKGFGINAKNGEVIIPNELTGFKDSIYNYLNTNQGKELLISAKHLASEANGTNHFGNSRASFVKNLLVKAGINPDKIVSKALLSEYNYDDNGNYYEGITMAFQDVSDERTAEIEKGVANKTLYTNFAAKEFKPDRSLTAYTLELKNYLAKYPNKKVYVEGHTDSIGVNNYKWGLDRANNVKNYLISQGIAANIIEVSSKGETAPVASNKTEEGRAKNRRIEITIK